MTVWASEAYSDTFPKAYANEPETKIDIHKLITYTPPELPPFPQGNAEPKEKQKEVPKTVKKNKVAKKAPVASKAIEYGKQQSAKMFGESHWNALYTLLMKESGFRPEAQNRTSTAYGIFQFLDSTWSGYGCVKSSDYKVQIDCGLKYIKSRYGNPTKALEFHRSRGWY